MAKRHRDILAKLDPVAINRYQITEEDIRTIEQYLKTIQKHLRFASTWDDIQTYPGPYATSLVVHEITEITALLTIEPKLLKLKTRDLAALLENNIAAHAQALYQEHLYLQDYIERSYNLQFEIATLIKANRMQTPDIETFMDSGLGLWKPEDERIPEVLQIIAELMGDPT